LNWKEFRPVPRRRLGRAAILRQMGTIRQQGNHPEGHGGAFGGEGLTVSAHPPGPPRGNERNQKLTYFLSPARFLDFLDFFYTLFSAL